MTDVRLYQTADGGEIDYLNGNPVMADGLETAAYLSLFGGNHDDSGTEGDDPRQWWGNVDETIEARKLRSETQFLLQGISNAAANVLRLQDAATRDLAWFVTEDIADRVAVAVSVPTLNTVNFEIEIEIDSTVYQFTITGTL
jgi:phage gp46-like protein